MTKFTQILYSKIIIYAISSFNKDGVTGSVDIKILPAKKDRKLTRETKVSVLPCVKPTGRKVPFSIYSVRDEREPLLATT